MPFQISLGNKKYQFQYEEIANNHIQLNHLINKLQCQFIKSIDENLSNQLTLFQYQSEIAATHEYINLLQQFNNQGTVICDKTTDNELDESTHRQIKTIVDSIIRSPINWVHFEKVDQKYRKNLLSLFHDIHTSRVSILFYLRCVCSDNSHIYSILKVKECVDTYLYMYLKDSYVSIVKNSQEKYSRSCQLDFIQELENLSIEAKHDRVELEFQRIQLCSDGIKQIFQEVFAKDFSQSHLQDEKFIHVDHEGLRFEDYNTLIKKIYSCAESLFSQLQPVAYAPDEPEFLEEKTEYRQKCISTVYRLFYGIKGALVSNVSYRRLSECSNQLKKEAQKPESILELVRS